MDSPKYKAEEFKNKKNLVVDRFFANICPRRVPTDADAD